MNLNDPSIAVIIPTIGRTTLADAIESVIHQLRGDDELIIVGDGPTPAAKDIYKHMYYRYPFKGFRYVELLNKVGDYGCSACDFGYHSTYTDVVCFLGDDDRHVGGSLEIIREGVKNDLTFPHLFAMIHTGRRLGNQIFPGAVSGQQIVVPGFYDHLYPKMANCPKECIATSDCWFIEQVEHNWGKVIMHDETIAILDKQNFGRML